MGCEWSIQPRLQLFRKVLCLDSFVPRVHRVNLEIVEQGGDTPPGKKGKERTEPKMRVKFWHFRVLGDSNATLVNKGGGDDKDLIG